MKTEQRQKNHSPKPRPDETGVVVPFPVRKPAQPPAPLQAFSNLSSDHPPVEDVAKYAKRGSEPDDYAHRMKMNAVAVVFLAALVAGGVWIVDVMAQQKKNQDCVLSGRRNCATIEAPVTGK